MDKKKNKKWIMRAIIGFIAILALLTFFSNTIMNLTIPKVVARNCVRGNLSYTNNATGVIEAENDVEVKGIDGRQIEKVELSNYEYVQEGTPVITLKTTEEGDDQLEALESQLEALQREADYASRQPSDPTDYTALNIAVSEAREALADAEQVLNTVRNAGGLRDSANATLAQYDLNALQASLDAASSRLDGLLGSISELESQIGSWESNVVNLCAVFTLEYPVYIEVIDEVTGEVTRKINLPDEVIATLDPTTFEPMDLNDQSLSDPNAKITELLKRIAVNQMLISQLNVQLADAQAAVATASGPLAEAEAAVAAAQETLASLEGLPTEQQAINAVSMAQSNLASAERTLSNQQTMDGIANDQAQDAINDRNESIADLEEEIAELRERLEVTTINAPVSGLIFGMAVADGDMLTKDMVVFTVIPDDSEFSVSLKFSSQVSESIYIGMNLTPNEYWVDSITVTNIKLDPDNPRESRVVKCSVEGYYIVPGQSITVVADRANANYDHVIPSSAINEDNTGTFVYVVVSSSSALGDKHEVRRVEVTVDATDGALSAISTSGDELDGNMVVTRSEEPLQNGDRVRLEDYTKSDDK